MASDEPIDPSLVTPPDSFGRILISLNLTSGLPNPNDVTGERGLGLVGYVVDGNRIRLVENNNDPIDCPNGWCGELGGTAYFQGANTGTFAAPTADTTYVFGANGDSVWGWYQAAGLVTLKALVSPATNSGSVTGFLNWNDLTGEPTTPPTTPIPIVAGTYTFDDATFPDGPSGRVSVVLTDSLTEPTFTYNMLLYLDGNGHATLISADFDEVLPGTAFLQTGGGSFTAASVAGNYGLAVTGYDLNLADEFDAVGAVTAAPPTAPATAGALASIPPATPPPAGSIDQNFYGTTTAGLVLAGTYTADAAGAGDFTDGMTGLDVDTPTNTDTFIYYVIDPTRVVAIETDANQLTLGYFELQQ